MMIVAGDLAKRSFLGLVWGGAMMALTACDTEVTNPGPVQDGFLNDPGAFEAVLYGAKHNVAFGFTRVAYAGAMVTGEALLGSFADNRFLNGELTSDNADEYWNIMHRGRWVAEDGVRRFREHMEPAEFGSSEMAAELLMEVGVANRTLGQHMCVAVIDGGEAQPYTVHFERAEAAFSEALEIARSAGNQDLEYAAMAARAENRIWLDDWDGALADASAIPDDFAHLMQFYDENTLTQGDQNQFQFGADPLRRQMTVWGTFADDYYEETGDPRTPWRTLPNLPLTLVFDYPFYQQRRHPEYTSPHRVATGGEMRLIEAEYALRQGDWQDAMVLINQVRAGIVSDHTGDPIPAADASNLEEAWTALKRERGIELWYEGRRFPDRRRWAGEDTPGALPGEPESLGDRSYCFPVGSTEIETNPNDLPVVN